MELIKLVKNYYGFTIKETKEYLKNLTKEEKENIKKSIKKYYTMQSKIDFLEN